MSKGSIRIYTFFGLLILALSIAPLISVRSEDVPAYDETSGQRDKEPSYAKETERTTAVPVATMDTMPTASPSSNASVGSLFSDAPVQKTGSGGLSNQISSGGGAQASPRMIPRQAPTAATAQAKAKEAVNDAVGAAKSTAVKGTGPCIAASNHKWKMHRNISFFGGSSECQGVAGPYPNTCVMNKKGPYYFATWHKKNNRYVPASLSSAPFGTKLIFRYKGKTCIAVYADHGPAQWTHRYLDVGQNVAAYLGIRGVADVEWDFANSGDKLK